MINPIESGFCPEKVEIYRGTECLCLQQTETGTPVSEVIRKRGIIEQTFYRWKKRYGSLGPSEFKKLKQFEEESRRLTQMLAGFKTG